MKVSATYNDFGIQCIQLFFTSPFTVPFTNISSDYVEQAILSPDYLSSIESKLCRMPYVASMIIVEC